MGKSKQRVEPGAKEDSATVGAMRSEDELPLRTIVFVVVTSLMLLFIKPAWSRPAVPGVAITEKFYSLGDGQLQANFATAPQLHNTFVPSDLDRGTQAFLSECVPATATWSGRIMLRSRHQLYLVLQRLLGWSHTDAAGLLGHVKLFPFSEEQLQRVLRSLEPPLAFKGATLLDVGAGEGTVTESLASTLRIQEPGDVWTIETSLPHRQSLARHGFNSVSSFDELQPRSVFDAVALLHVLDRCDQPRALLELAAQRVAPGGLLIVATPLPFCAKVWSGRFGRVLASRLPDEPLKLSAEAACDAEPSFTTSVTAIAMSAFEPLRTIGVEIEAWTRLPYLSCATAKTHHALDSALFVLRKQQKH